MSSWRVPKNDMSQMRQQDSLRYRENLWVALALAKEGIDVRASYLMKAILDEEIETAKVTMAVKKRERMGGAFCGCLAAQGVTD